MKLFISPSEEIGRIIDTHSFMKELKLRWPTAQIEEINDPNRGFSREWEISSADKYLSGKLSKEEDTIIFDFSDIYFGADFSVWAFSQLVQKDKILLYDDSYSTVLPLNEAIRAADIINEFSKQ